MAACGWEAVSWMLIFLAETFPVRTPPTSNISTATIIGIAVAVPAVLIVLLIIFTLLCVMIRKRRTKSNLVVNTEPYYDYIPENKTAEASTGRGYSDGVEGNAVGVRMVRNTAYGTAANVDDEDEYVDVGM